MTRKILPLAALLALTWASAAQAVGYCSVSYQIFRTVRKFRAAAKNLGAALSSSESFPGIQSRSNLLRTILKTSERL